MPNAALVMTTIFDPVILETYQANLARYGHLDDLDVILIGDRKTPPAAAETCDRLRARGMHIIAPTLDQQDCFLKRIGLDPGFIPYNSDNRRNIGYLMAWERRPDFVISVDDDNYCLDDEDYFGAHAAALGDQTLPLASSATRFPNVCELLDFECSAPVYARGYPYFARQKQDRIEYREGRANVMINAGLWITDPDVDALTWLGVKPRVTGFRDRSAALDAASWSPVNSQNTALVTDLMPAYYFIRMGYPVNGMAVDRYGDIFSGYFALACARHLGGTARFGTPIADHRRNRHDYLRDASAEWQAILVLEDVLAWLVDARLQGSTCCEAYESLSHALEDAVERFRGPVWSDAARGFFHQMAHCMRTWTKACRTLQ